MLDVPRDGCFVVQKCGSGDDAVFPFDLLSMGAQLTRTFPRVPHNGMVGGDDEFTGNST